MPWYSPGDPDYDPAAQPAAFAGGAYAVANDRLWIFGGSTDFATGEDTVYSFDPIANAWTLEGTLPAGVAPQGSAAIIGNVAYLMTPAGLWAYNLDTGATNVTLTAPSAGGDDRYNLIEIDGLLYWKLGHGSEAEVYNPGTDSWTAVAAGPAGTSEGRPVGTDGTYAYLLLADASGVTMHRYDPVADAWTSIATDTLTTPERVTSAPMLHRDGVLYIVGGQSYAESFLSQASVLAFDIATTSFVAMPDMGEARAFAHAGWVGSHLIVAGGAHVEYESGLGNPPTVTMTDTVEVHGDTWPRQVQATLTLQHQPSYRVLQVRHEVGWPTEALLPVSWRTDRAGGDAGATLRVSWATGATREASLPIMWSAVAPGGVSVTDAPGATGGVPAGGGGPTETGAIEHSLGGGPVATLERLDGTFATAGHTTFSQHIATPAGWRRLDVGMRTADAPYGRSWGTSDGVPITTFQTGDHRAPLQDTVLPELVERAEVVGGSIAYGVPASAGSRPTLYGLDEQLGVAGRPDDDCGARQPLDNAGGGQTRLQLAIAAVAEAGMTLTVLGTIPNADRAVPSDYTTEGATADAVLNDMLLASDPRVWYLDGVVIVDGRTFATQETTDPAAFLDADLLADDGASWSDQAGRTDPEPLLADYTSECDREDPAGDGPGSPDGTFETFETGVYSWTERSGTGLDRQTVAHELEKQSGRLVREEAETSGYFQPFEGARYWGVIARTETEHAYHPVCPEALVSTIETTRQRRSRDDLQRLSATPTEAEVGTAPWAVADQQTLFEAIPDWYEARRVLLDQRWHAEGWLRERIETTRELDGMIADPVTNIAGEVTGYNVTLTYRAATRTESFVPVGNGLWHVKTVIRATRQQPVYEPVNPDAEEGDDDYGEVELTAIMAIPTTNTYTEVTDQAPPSISCGSGDCDEGGDPYETCVARATARWEEDHANWEARMQHAGPKRVWTLRANRLVPGVRVGQALAGGLVASVAHERGDVNASTTIQVWEWLP